MFQHLPNGGFRSQTVEFAEGFRFAVLDELIRPADAFDWRVNTRVVEVLNDGSAEAVEEHMVFKSADDFAFPTVFLEHVRVERLDEARVD